jgi:hypothetical protein
LVQRLDFGRGVQKCVQVFPQDDLNTTRLPRLELARPDCVPDKPPCIFFSMVSFMFGMAVSGYVWFSTDFMRRFGVVFWSAMTAVAIYPVRRDAKRPTDAAASSHVTSVQRDE